MPQSESQLPDNRSSEADPVSETLFLLSICRDEDDAAALRSDLKRSALGNYKIQRCAHLDDANHLLQVCGFDLAFIRLDDFQDKQAAVDLIRQSDTDLSIIGLLSSRLIATEDFTLPKGIDAHCRLEDLSPTLVSNLVSSVLEQKRNRKETIRLGQELHFAIDVGDLGTWSLDIETGRVTLNETAARQLKLAAAHQIPFLDDLIEAAYPSDQDRLKRLFDLAIETQGDLKANFRLNRPNNKPGHSIEISAKYRPGNARANPTLYGFLKREAQTTEDIQERIESANQAIQKALTLRDDAIETASRELELLMQKMNSIQESPAKATPTISKKHIEPPTFRQSPPEPKAPPAIKAVPETALHPHDSSDDTLAIDKPHALQNVLKAITRQKRDQSDNTFPFDFSTELHSDYTEPNPHHDGFVGAAKRLVSITKNGHQLSVTLSIENDGAIECERERDLLFEILRELLTNVVKHAHATECIIALFRDEDDWVLQVEDDGVGLENNLVSISTPLNKIGLFRIRTKLALKGGQLDLTPTFPKGLIARARLPVSLSNRDAERLG